MGGKETPEEGKQQVRPKVALEGKGHIPKSLPSLRPAVKPKVQRGTHTCPAAVDNAINTPLFQDYPHKGCLPLQRTPLLPSPHPQGPKCPLYSRPGGGQGVLLGSTFPLRVYLACSRITTTCRQEPLLSAPRTLLWKSRGRAASLAGLPSCWMLQGEAGIPQLAVWLFSLSATHRRHGLGVTGD